MPHPRNAIAAEGQAASSTTAPASIFQMSRTEKVIASFVGLAEMRCDYLLQPGHPSNGIGYFGVLCGDAGNNVSRSEMPWSSSALAIALGTRQRTMQRCQAESRFQALNPMAAISSSAEEEKAARSGRSAALAESPRRAPALRPHLAPEGAMAAYLLEVADAPLRKAGQFR